MRIGLITTLNTNIGDDLIREGIRLILDSIFTSCEINYIPINKHRPYTVYPQWHPLNILPHGKRKIGRYLHVLGLTKFDNCDLIVQCGAPVLWPNCHRNEWAEPIWNQVIGRLYEKIPVFNIAAGSCYPWENQPEKISDPEDEKYLRNILRYCRVTTVRDKLAHRLVSSLGSEARFLPCSAFVSAINSVESKDDEKSLVLINYMKGGGHYDWRQNIEPATWEIAVKTLIDRLKSRHELAFLCHNEEEYNLASCLAPELRRFWPKSISEYYGMIKNTKAAICNRMHASVALAGLGIPSVSVCTDTRLLMVEALGLPCFYVKEADAGILEYELEMLIKNSEKEKERLLELRAGTWDQYVKIIQQNIP